MATTEGHSISKTDMLGTDVKISIGKPFEDTSNNVPPIFGSLILPPAYDDDAMPMSSEKKLCLPKWLSWMMTR